MKTGSVSNTSAAGLAFGAALGAGGPARTCSVGSRVPHRGAPTNHVARRRGDGLPVAHTPRLER